ncbi:hypothetical protein [Mycobacterium sp.]|uniref:hypothetical protein n=1 Tax=Mycobacterium sp. TaxID=1785 RepID=UPI0031E1EF3F
MRTRPVRWVVAATAVVALLTGYESKVPGAPTGRSPQPRPDVVAPSGQETDPPDAPLAEPAVAWDGLSTRIRAATNEAAADGAVISVAVLDRATGQVASNGRDRLVGIASVAKLFIADDLLLRQAQGKVDLSPQDRQALDVMLSASDDGAAERFWNQRGAQAVIAEVARRYGLTSTTPPHDGRWWNTMSSATDLLRYYDMLLSGSGGLPPEQADVIVGDLARSTPTGADGYPQRFGIPDGLPSEPVAVKQGWMCCIGQDWMHLSTGVIGADRRYVMVIESLQPSDDATARATITRAVRTIFPTGEL